MTLPSPVMLASIFSGVTRPMLGFPFDLDAAEPGPELFWRSSVMRLGGPAPLSIAISSDEAGCAALARAIFGGDGAALELADDALGELVNVIAGGLKWRLRIEQPLVPPRAVAGGKAPPLPPSAREVRATLRGPAGVRIVLSVSLV